MRNKVNMALMIEDMMSRVSGVSTYQPTRVKMLAKSTRSQFKILKIKRATHKAILAYGAVITVTEGIRVGYDKKDIAIRKEVQRARKGGVIIC